MNQTAVNNQSLLEAIRQSETASARQLAATREAAAIRLKEAREQADQTITQAAKEGQQKGEAARQAAQQEIEQEAEEILAQAKAEAETLHNLAEDTVAVALKKAMNIITGLESRSLS